MTADLDRAWFAQRLGSTVGLRLADGLRVALRVERIEDFDPANGPRFSVVLSGPDGRVLPQGAYPVEETGVDADLFVVPVGRAPQAIVYEAAFNLERG